MVWLAMQSIDLALCRSRHRRRGSRFCRDGAVSRACAAPLRGSATDLLCAPGLRTPRSAPGRRGAAASSLPARLFSRARGILRRRPTRRRADHPVPAKPCAATLRQLQFSARHILSGPPTRSVDPVVGPRRTPSLAGDGIRPGGAIAASCLCSSVVKPTCSKSAQSSTGLAAWCVGCVEILPTINVECFLYSCL